MSEYWKEAQLRVDDKLREFGMPVMSDYTHEADNCHCTNLDDYEKAMLEFAAKQSGTEV